MDDEPDNSLDPGFAARFERDADRPPCQLYLISPRRFDVGFVDTLARALDGGPVAAFQFRLEGVDAHSAARIAEPVQRVCATHDVAFIVHGSVALAKRLAADGVHLGQEDDPRDARHALGPSVQIGVTCDGSRHLAMEAGEAGADYVSFGPFFPSAAEGVQQPPELSILSWWSTLFELPCVAAGGITPANARPLVEAGADFLAVSASVWDHPGGPEAAVAAFAELLAR